MEFEAGISQTLQIRSKTRFMQTHPRIGLRADETEAYNESIPEHVYLNCLTKWRLIRPTIITRITLIQITNKIGTALTTV